MLDGLNLPETSPRQVSCRAGRSKVVNNRRRWWCCEGKAERSGGEAWSKLDWGAGIYSITCFQGSSYLLFVIR